MQHCRAIGRPWFNRFMDTADALILALLAVADIFLLVQLRRRRIMDRWAERIEHNLRLANQFLGS